MRASTMFVAAAALIIGAEANPMRRDDPHRTDFRIWSEKGCGLNGNNTGNLGVWTITQSQTNQCQPSFNAPVVQGIYLNNLDATVDCKFFAYTEENCSGTPLAVTPKQCADPGDANFVSFQVDCNTD
ncbi:hypothetical protein CkaCkLH20_07125 [Colletotrichum karsti]|uniref:Uncharacterized protein n=1 Tax=Colletotrichum karsti TaxID=1095194 RepID=A0A9P6IAZ2_9PEZI|nr:uncharacterized protein CkaCkLH20_07125 [Colletotrichum karsti]KAF9875305.1 hypothetical protein CkaCkLH20_07125 [Colletotrichum karsti]